MATTSSINSITKLRLTGLSSGMDTDAIIQNLMQIEQLKLNRHLRQQTTNGWKLEALKANHTTIRNFRQTYLTALSSSASAMMTAGTYKAYNAKVTGDNAGAISVTANSNAKVGSVTVNQVEQLARAASIKGTKASTGESIGESNSIKLKDLDAKLAGSFGFAATPVLDENGVQETNEDGSPKTELTGKIKLSIGTSAENMVEFEFDANDTLQTVMSKINNSDAGVTLSYSRLTDTFSLSTKETGEDKEIYLQTAEKADGAGSGDFFSALGIDLGSASEEIDPADGDANSAGGKIYRFGEDEYGGKNAVVYIDDGSGSGSVRVERSSNNFTIDGLQYTLNEKTDPDANIKISVSQNIDDPVEKIKSFVEAYNTLIGKLDEMISTRKEGTEKSYIPLTEDEKAAMTEDQIKEWENIAKKGLLYNDGDLKSLVNGLRNALTASVEGVGLSMNSIGFTTGNYFDGKRGQIVIDETKLRAALEKDADQVMRVFTQTSDAADSAQKYKESGFLNRVNDLMYAYEKKLDGTTTVGLEKNIKDLASKITSMQEKMLALEERYYKQYAAMETALSKMQSQTNWIASMMGGSQ